MKSVCLAALVSLASAGGIGLVCPNVPGTKPLCDALEAARDNLAWSAVATEALAPEAERRLA